MEGGRARASGASTRRKAVLRLEEAFERKDSAPKLSQQVCLSVCIRPESFCVQPVIMVPVQA